MGEGFPLALKNDDKRVEYHRVPSGTSVRFADGGFGEASKFIAENAARDLRPQTAIHLSS